MAPLKLKSDSDRKSGIRSADAALLGTKANKVRKTTLNSDPSISTRATDICSIADENIKTPECRNHSEEIQETRACKEMEISNMMTLKIMNLNVAGITAAISKGLMGYIEVVNPDIICLQETKLREVPSPKDASGNPNTVPFSRKTYPYQ